MRINKVIIDLSIGELSIENRDNYHELISVDTKGKTQRIGEPELPTYSFNYAIDRDKIINNVLFGLPIFYYL